MKGEFISLARFQRQVAELERQHCELVAATITDMITVIDKAYEKAYRAKDKEAIIQHGSAKLVLKQLNDRLEYLLPRYTTMKPDLAAKIILKRSA